MQRKFLHPNGGIFGDTNYDFQKLVRRNPAKYLTNYSAPVRRGAQNFV